MSSRQPMLRSRMHKGYENRSCLLYSPSNSILAPRCEEFARGSADVGSDGCAEQIEQAERESGHAQGSRISMLLGSHRAG
eukprot:55775-Hanusia_phi.AAC.3